MKVLFCVLSFWAGVLAAAGPVRTIEDFTADFETAFPVLLAEDNLDASRFARQRVDAANGWKFFANFGGGYVQDIVVTNRTRNFATIGGRIGVEYPLLGSAEEERRGLSEAQKEVDLNSIRLQWIKQQARMQIAEDYALYWGLSRRTIWRNCIIN